MSQFMPKPSSTYKVAIDAMRQLAESEGAYAIERATAEILQPLRESLFLSTVGIREAKGHPCAKRLAGKRCTMANPAGCDCLLERASAQRTLWNSDGHPAKLVAQPYELSFAELEEIVDYCRKYDLQCSVSGGTSWHFPGRTLFVQVEPKK